MLIINLTIIALGYLIGSLQPAYILGKAMKNIDIRRGGSGNSGASNAVIMLGWKFGVVVALIDIGKGFLSLVLMSLLFSKALQHQLSFYLILNGLFVILGHNHPFYMGFRGGKGTASFIGILLAFDYRIALIAIATIVIVTIITDYISIGTIALVSGCVIAAIYFNYSTGTIALLMIIACMSIYRHLPNIGKIRRGEETGLRKTLKKK